MRQWDDVAAAILDRNREIQQAIRLARDVAAADQRIGWIRELDRLAAIGAYSTYVATLVCGATAALDMPSGIEAPVRSSDLRGHLRTLRVLHDVLRLTARRRSLDRPPRPIRRG